MEERETKSNPLLEILRVEASARSARDIRSLGFVIANETHRIVTYRQAFFCIRKGSRFCLETISGLASIDRNTPFHDWFEALLKELEHLPEGSEPVDLVHDEFSDTVTRGWDEWLPPHLAAVRLIAPGSDACSGLLLLAREKPLEDFERECLKELATAFAHDIKALTGHHSPGSILTEKLFRRPKRMAVTAAVALAALLFPVRQSSLGTAEVTPLSYSVISAPLDGVIASVPVNPNDQVARGQVLFRIDDASIRNRLAAARSSMGVAQSEAFLSQQKAFLDPQARSEVATYQARVREKGSSIEYLSELRRKTEVTAPSPGVVLFGDKTDWEGKPVTVGERVMTLADRGSAGVTVWIPAADAINLEKGARVKLFLHTDPLHVREAAVIRASYQPVLSPEGIAAYRVTAGFTEKKDLPRLGLRGTAKVYGGRVTLAYYVFRRPVAKLRQWMGL